MISDNTHPYGSQFVRSSAKISECEILSTISRPTSTLTGISRPQTSFGGRGDSPFRRTSAQTTFRQHLRSRNGSNVRNQSPRPSQDRILDFRSLSGQGTLENNTNHHRTYQHRGHIIDKNLVIRKNQQIMDAKTNASTSESAYQIKPRTTQTRHIKSRGGGLIILNK
jgi:hypothetical protein